MYRSSLNDVLSVAALKLVAAVFLLICGMGQSGLIRITIHIRRMRNSAPG